MVGQISILGGRSNDFFFEKRRLSGCATWLLIATACSLPVSTTHSLVSAMLGFSLLQRGTAGLRWWKVVKIGAVTLLYFGKKGSVATNIC